MFKGRKASLLLKRPKHNRAKGIYNISVIGAGYVGLVTSAAFASLGHKVICVDIDKEKVDKINSGEPPIYEKGLKEILSRTVPHSLSATTNLPEAVMNTKITFICVGTPSKKRGDTQFKHIESVSVEIGKVLKRKESGHIIVVKSTVPPETTENMIIPIVEKYSGKKFGVHFGAVMNPEFLREGSALDDFFHPDRIIIGSTDKKSIEVIKRLYKDFNSPILEVNFKEAEMIKYASNSFLATKISFINEIGNICKTMDINTNIVAKGMGLDHRISPHFLNSGIGFGGSCFPKDISALIFKAIEKGYSPRLLRSVLDVNNNQPFKILEILEKYGSIKGKKIAVLGLTYKAGTDDIRDSPSLEIIKELIMEEPELYVYDPLAIEKVKNIFPHLNYEVSGQEAVNKSEIVLILTEWPEFKKIDYGEKIVIDGKNLFDSHKNIKKPKNYEGICW